MKSWSRAGFGIAGIVVVLLLFPSCSTVYEVGGERFVELAEEIPQIHSARSTQLIGVSGERVYLERWQAPLFAGSGIDVYWTRLSELPPNVAEVLQSGRNPWESVEPPRPRR